MCTRVVGFASFMRNTTCFPLSVWILALAAGCDAGVGGDDLGSVAAAVVSPVAGTYHIESAYSGKVLDVADWSTEGGGNIQQWTLHGGANQTWQLAPVGDGQYEIRSVHSGQCLDVDGWSAADGANVIQWPCHGGANQRFSFNAVVDDQVLIVPASSGSCLDVAEWVYEDGANIQQWGCSGWENQRWRLVSAGASIGTRQWATADLNGDGVWNWSTTVSEGGSSIVGGNEYGDIPYYSNGLSLQLSHDGTGYAAANITSGVGPDGVEPQSQEERDAGKPVDPTATLRFVRQGRTSPIRLELVDAAGRRSPSVRVADFEEYCGPADCRVAIPLAVFDDGAFDFSQVVSVTLFVDATVPAGYYYAAVSNVVFDVDDGVIDPQTDPDNCGALGHSCLGGACVNGLCQAGLLIDDFTCSLSMAADDAHIFVSDSGTIYRYDIDGSNRIPWHAGDASYPYSLLRAGDQLFWTDSTGLRRRNDDSSVVSLYDESTSVGQVHVTGSTVVAYDYLEARFFSVARDASGPGDYDVIHELGAQYPAVSEATERYLYYYYGSVSGSSLLRVDRDSGDVLELEVDTSVFGMWSHENTVYWSYRDSAGASGIRRLSDAPGSTVEEAVAVAHGNAGVGSPFVDASGIYHSSYDGTTNRFVRTSHTDPNDVVVVTATYYPYSSNNVAFTDDSLIWLVGCSRGGPGYVAKLAKP